MNDEQRQRYTAAAHAMQSGVEYLKGYQPRQVDPKHLRVGVNSAMVETSTLAQLLIAKGIITEDEFAEALIAQMQAEAGSYAKQLEIEMGCKVSLG
ncbi:hypothetical protein [Sphingobium indicum]